MEPSKPESLGSLAQSARSKKLNQARALLIVVGLLTLGVNLYQVISARKLAKDAIEAEVKKQGGIPDPVKVQEVEDQVVRVIQIVGSGLIVIGALFVVFGIIIHLAPVPVTIISLVLYVGATAVFAVVDPKTVMAGIVIKVIIIVCLAQSIQTALAFQREEAEKKRALMQEEPADEPAPW